MSTVFDSLYDTPSAIVRDGHGRQITIFNVNHSDEDHITIGCFMNDIVKFENSRDPDDIYIDDLIPIFRRTMIALRDKEGFMSYEYDFLDNGFRWIYQLRDNNEIWSWPNSFDFYMYVSQYCTGLAKWCGEVLTKKMGRKQSKNAMIDAFYKGGIGCAIDITDMIFEYLPITYSKKELSFLKSIVRAKDWPIGNNVHSVKYLASKILGLDIEFNREDFNTRLE